MQIKKIDTCFLYVFMIKTIKIGLKMAKIAAGKAEFWIVKPRIFGFRIAISLLYPQTS